MTAIIMYMLIAFVAVILSLSIGADLYLRRQWGLWPWHTPLYRKNKRPRKRA